MTAVVVGALGITGTSRSGEKGLGAHGSGCITVEVERTLGRVGTGVPKRQGGALPVDALCGSNAFAALRTSIAGQLCGAAVAVRARGRGIRCLERHVEALLAGGAGGAGCSEVVGCASSLPALESYSAALFFGRGRGIPAARDAGC